MKINNYGKNIWSFWYKNLLFHKGKHDKNGPLVFRTVLCSKYDEKLGNCERKTLRQVVG
jgi:hypothetical protein